MSHSGWSWDLCITVLTLVVRVACELSMEPLRTLWAAWLRCTCGNKVLANGPLYDITVFLFLLLSLSEEELSESEHAKSLSYWLEEEAELNLRGAEQGGEEKVKMWDSDWFTADASCLLLKTSADLDLLACDWLGAETRDKEVEDGLWGGTWIWFSLVKCVLWHAYFFVVLTNNIPYLKFSLSSYKKTN